MNSRVFAVLALCVVAVAADYCDIQGRYCLNGGVCHDKVSGNAPPGSADPACLCPAGFGGPDCAFKIRECSDNPCMNGGSCTPTGSCSASSFGWDCFKCKCAPGWAGAPTVAFGTAVTQAGMCEYFVGDPCGSPNFCQNGGTCTYNTVPNVNGKYTCGCTTGWYGVNCTLTCDGSKAGGATAACAAGTCDTTSGQCNCGTTGKVGPTCSIDGFCGTTNPCKNTATCTNTVSGTGYPDDPYVYSGYCGTGSVNHNCVGAFRGKYCDQANFCSANPSYCNNGGTCNEPDYTTVGGSSTDDATALTGSCTCVANKGFAGPTCNVQISGCYTYNLYATNPPLANSAILKCSNGASCPCDTPDHCNNGNSGDPWQVKCRCGTGFGDCRCNTTYSSLCPSSSTTDPVCKNGGTCSETRDSWYCSCRSGFWGDRCENYDNPCLNNPCQNNGRCRIITNTFGFPRDDRFWAWDCDCKYPYYGVRCENKADLWTTCMGDNPCKNGGTCIRNTYQVAYNGVGGGGFWHLDSAPGFAFGTGGGATSYRLQDQPWACKCPKGFWGVDCSLTTNPDVVTCTSSTACLNGGTCFVGSGKKYTQCACPCGYTGHLCQIAAVQTTFNGFVGIGARMQFCSNGIACQNGGTCADAKDGTSASCLCATSYYGNYCEMKGKSAASSVAPSMLVVAAAAIIAALKF